VWETIRKRTFPLSDRSFLRRSKRRRRAEFYCSFFWAVMWRVTVEIPLCIHNSHHIFHYLSGSLGSLKQGVHFTKLRRTTFVLYSKSFLWMIFCILHFLCTNLAILRPKLVNFSTQFWCKKCRFVFRILYFAKFLLNYLTKCLVKST
jgi:hypothetical protein